MYSVGDVIVLHSWDKLKEMFGMTKCDDGHECINTNPALIDRYKSHYRNGMRINGIFDGCYQTNQCVIPHEAVAGLAEEKKGIALEAPADAEGGEVTAEYRWEDDLTEADGPGEAFDEVTEAIPDLQEGDPIQVDGRTYIYSGTGEELLEFLYRNILCQ